MISLDRRRLWFGKLIILSLLTATAGAALLPAFRAAADFALAEWQYYKPLALPPELTAGQLAAATLDREVFQQAAAAGRPDLLPLRDLRVIRDDGTEVPYQLRIADGRAERETAPAQIRDLGHLPGQYTSFIADLGAGGIRHNEVEIFTDSTTFGRKTMVEARRDDAAPWVILQEGAEIFAFAVAERDFAARHTRIRYPESTARYLRVRIINGSAEPLNITGAAVSLTRERAEQEMDYRPAVVRRGEDASSRATVVTLDLGGPGIPSGRLSFHTPAANFHRDARIAGSADGNRWEELNAAAVYRYSTPNFSDSNREISYPESRYRYYRLTVENNDDPPLPLTDITLHGLARRVIFPAEPGVSYALYYGNPAARQPAYELERLAAWRETEDLPAAMLGAQQANPSFTGHRLPLTERYPWLITAAVAAAALVLAALLYGVIRQARGRLRPPESGC